MSDINLTTISCEVPKLFYVNSTGIVNGRRDVPIDWFAVRGFDDLDPGLPWAAMIDGYKPGLDYPLVKDRVAELFTEAEARMLVA
jgi:hypothetical protein